MYVYVQSESQIKSSRLLFTYKYCRNISKIEIFAKNCNFFLSHFQIIVLKITVNVLHLAVYSI